MNRAQRRAAARGELLVTVTTTFQCVECLEFWTHVEIWDGSDEALGLPHSMMGCMECGGDLVRVEVEP